VFEMYSLYRLE